MPSEAMTPPIPKTGAAISEAVQKAEAALVGQNIEAMDMNTATHTSGEIKRLGQNLILEVNNCTNRSQPGGDLNPCVEPIRHVGP